MKLNNKILISLLGGLVIFYIIISLFRGTYALDEVPANPAFDDINFYRCVVDAYNKKNNTDVGYDVNLTDEQLKTITDLRCDGFGKKDDEKIVSAKGLERLTELLFLNLSDTKLTLLDVSQNIKLASLTAYYSQLIELDVSQNTKLQSLMVSSNQITELDVVKNLALTTLWVNSNQITELDVSQNTKLTSLNVSVNQITELDVSQNNQLTYLDASSNKLTELDVSQNTKLTSLNVSNNQITGLDVSQNIKLTDLKTYNSQLTELDVSQNTQLTQLIVSSNQIMELDVSQNNQLTYLDASSNKLTELDVSQNTELTNLHVENNQLTELDVSKNTKLTTLIVFDNQFGENLYVYKGNTIKVTNSVKIPSHLNWNEPTWTSKDISITSINGDVMVTALKNGKVDIVGVVSGKYTTTSTINVVEIISDEYNVDNLGSEILVDKTSIPYDEFVSNVNVSDDNITYKIYNGSNEVTSGNVTKGMTLKVYYGDEVLKEFNITDEYLEFDESLNIDDSNKYISNVGINTKVSDLLNKINTSGDIVITNKNGKILSNNDIVGTGSKISIKLSKETYEYLIIINGDVDGDGALKLSDIMKIANYVYINKNSLTSVYLKAADYDKNGSYNLQDIMKLANRVYKGGN